MKTAADHLKELAGGTIFSVFFTKRTTGEPRKMVCRLGVRKGLSGVGSYDPESKGLVTVWEMAKGYRRIPLDGIQKLVIRGETIEVRSVA